MKDIDYLIIGAGLSGSVVARELTDRGYKCVILEERDGLITVGRLAEYKYYDMEDTIKSALKVARELCERQ